MKRKIKIKNIILTLILVVTLIPNLVSASVTGTLTQEKVEDVWYTRRGGSGSYMSAQFTLYSIDGQTVYCIEPGVSVTTDTYIGELGIVNSPYDEETTKLLELIAYYGYDYEGHDTLAFRMATQKLIWNTVSDQTLEFWTEASGWGDYIDVSEEEDIIMALVEAHYDKPSFNGTTIELEIGEEYVLTDTTGVLSEYEIYTSANIDAQIIGDSLYITPNAMGELEIVFVRKSYDSISTIIFVGDDDESQKMGLLRFSDPVFASLNLEVTGGTVEISKLDSTTNSSNALGDATLSGAVYGVYSSAGSKITEITTDKNGKAISSNILDIGTYYLQEITPSTGYLLDDTKYYFEITVDDLNIEVNVYEDVITREFQFTKVYADANTGIMTAEANVQFEIYDSTNNLVTTLTSDSDGRFNVELPYGTYTVRQITTTDNYEMLKDFTIQVLETGDIEYYVLSNAETTAKLQVTKVDSDTGEVISLAGFTFKIFDVTNNEYVCQTITYPYADTLCEFSTDENGVLITPYALSTGSYILEEVDLAIDGYLWNSETISFDISSNSDFIYDEIYGTLLEINFSNTEVKGQIEITKYGEEFIVSDDTFYYEEILLEGVFFGLYANEDIYSSAGILQYSENDLITTAFTDENGTINIDDLYLGKYYLVELDTVDNYILDTTVYEFELTYVDQYTPIVYYEFEVQNYLIKNDLEFTKYDLFTDEILPNALIEIYTFEDELIYTGYTDENGLIVVNDLFIGEYYLIEVEAPTGYVLTKDKVFFEIIDSEENVITSMTNKPIESNIEFTKYDLENEEVLPNALIEIYTLEDELIYSGFTNEDGILFIDRLSYGEYYLIEIEAPTGYVLSDEKIYFSVTTEKELILLNMANEKIKSTIIIYKVDEDNIPVENVGVKIYDSDDNLIGEYYTNENGIIEVVLEYGEYYYQEFETSEDLILDDSKYYFSVTSDEELLEYTLINEFIEIEVPITSSNSIFMLIPIFLLSTGITLLFINKKTRRENNE